MLPRLSNKNVESLLRRQILKYLEVPILFHNNIHCAYDLYPSSGSIR